MHPTTQGARVDTNHNDLAPGILSVRMRRLKRRMVCRALRSGTLTESGTLRSTKHSRTFSPARRFGQSRIFAPIELALWEEQAQLRDKETFDMWQCYAIEVSLHFTWLGY